MRDRGVQKSNLLRFRWLDGGGPSNACPLVVMFSLACVHSISRRFTTVGVAWMDGSVVVVGVALMNSPSR